MKSELKNKDNRPEAYPKPTETDTQLNNQPEYTEPLPNTSEDQQPSSNELQEAQERMRKAGGQ